MRRRLAPRPRGGRLTLAALALAIVFALVGTAAVTLGSASREAARRRVAADVQLPVLPPLETRYEGVPLSERLEGFDGGHGAIDELLTTPVLSDPDFTRAVHDWIGYWRGPAAAWFPGFLERMARFGPTVDSALVDATLPPSMRYLPLIESGYDPRVRSRAQAVGLWQLMASTADQFGLEVGDVLDERRHVEKSTAAAVRYLDDLHDEFGSWFFALAAYNWGPSRVRGVLRRHAAGREPTDSLFWALRARFPRETREFVPKLYGAMWVASHPEAYGYERPEVEPYLFDLVSVPDATTLHVVALASGAEYADVVRLNPEYVQAITPEDRASAVRIPAGRARTFLRIYPRIHPAERMAVPDDGRPAS